MPMLTLCRYLSRHAMSDGDAAADATPPRAPRCAMSCRRKSAAAERAAEMMLPALRLLPPRALSAFRAAEFSFSFSR